MNNSLILKVYDIDYSFIIKNYLDPKLWEKTWTLFMYKEFVITLNLSSISCTDERILFKLSIKDTGETRKYKYSWGNNYDKNAWTSVDYSLKIEDITFLKRKIQNTAYKLIIALEEQYIRSLDDYIEIQENSSYEEDKLREIAEDFLDENGVRNEEIREVYIDNYIDNNKTIENKLNNIIEEYSFTLFTDLYLVFAKATKDENLIKEAQDDTDKVSNIDEIKKEVQDYLEYIETEDFVDEMSAELEEV